MSEVYEGSNQQAKDEGYWPATHGSEFIDERTVRAMVKDFIAKHPAPKMPEAGLLGSDR